jgi:hypothetical protein
MFSIEVRHVAFAELPVENVFRKTVTLGFDYNSSPRGIGFQPVKSPHDRPEAYPTEIADHDLRADVLSAVELPTRRFAALLDARSSS